MFPPLTLKDPRHEIFAIALAEGLPATAAYIKAGHKPNNAKARGSALAKNPEIIRRVGHLRACRPRIHDLQARHAPSTLFMPETKEHLQAFLWQVFTGARQITGLQFRAVALFARIRGWHLKDITSFPHATTPKPAAATSSDLTPEERILLAALILQTATADSNLTSIPTAAQQTFLSSMADACWSDWTDPSDQTDPADPSEKVAPTPPAPSAETSAQPPPNQSSTTPNFPTVIPAKSPPQVINSEALNRNNPHHGINLRNPAPPPPSPEQPAPAKAAPPPPKDPPRASKPTPPPPPRLDSSPVPLYGPGELLCHPPGTIRKRWTSH